MSSEQQQHQAPRFCADCFKGTLRGDTELKGTVETVYGLPTYVARPEAGRDEPAGVVVILPDAMGWELQNTRALADAYANRIPAVVLLPELMNGEFFFFEKRHSSFVGFALRDCLLLVSRRKDCSFLAWVWVFR